MSKKLLLIFILLCLAGIARSQEIVIRCNDEPLNRVLIDLRSRYSLMLSFDDAQLSAYKLTADKSFPSADLAFDFIFTGLPLKYEIVNGVYIIYTVHKKERHRQYILSGRIIDNSSEETLPFSGLLINNSVTTSDVKGNFSFVSSTDSIFKVRVSYVGYYILDTVVNSGTSFRFRLKPSVLAMKEVVIEGEVVARTIQAGSSPGLIRINHKIACFLPGNGDNSVFNLLRLQPGILASGEQSADLIIWGSYEGQSQVIFDGFTIYGMKNFNDNISAVNPYMAKDLKVLKGSFGAEYGERVGGIVDITGTDGNRMKPVAQLSVNNMTLSGLASVPLTKKSALLVAYRQTYYDLYNPVSFSTSGYGRGKLSSPVDYYLTPDYRFRDINFKYSGSGNKSNYYISLYGGKDKFAYDFDQESMQKTITLNHKEDNLQLGGTLFYGLQWRSRNTTNFILSSSSLQSKRFHYENIIRTSGQQGNTTIYDDYGSSVNEINARAENRLDISGSHQVDAGAGLLYYFTHLKETDQLGSSTLSDNSLTVPYLYVQDNISLFKRVTLRPGLRADFHSLSDRVYVQPRLSVLYRINDFLRVNVASGMYNQFVAKNMIVETTGNYRLQWSLCDNGEVSVLNSQSVSAGMTYDRNGLVLSAEGYLKSTGGITRYIETETSASVFRGDSRTAGMDLFIKKEFKNQTFWVSYTLSKTVEYFPYFPVQEYMPAMQDQRHEVKLAALTKIRAFHFSVNYVYGSGFPDPAKLPETVAYTQPYSRLDAAIVYQASAGKLHLDAGISVLNVLNTENIRYSNYTRIPADETTTINLYADAVPLTPTLFLNLYF